MHYKQITRTNPTTGRTERPWRNKDHFFVLGDPSKGEVKHHDQHAAKVDNYGEALELVERGFSIRMSDGKSPPSLVTPASITFLDEPVSTLDDLWTYSMPDVPFSRHELEDDIRAALLSQAAEIYWIAGPEAANAFIGLKIDVDAVEHGTQAAQIELKRFNFARVVLNAYESAYRTGAGKLISDDDIDELELMIGAMFSSMSRRYDNPADRRGSPLRRTMLSAYLRWKMSEGYLFDNKLDQSAVENLAILADMSEQAVRNSLNKEKLSAVKGKLDNRAVIRWLQNRRDFVPLRESERPESRWTFRALHLFRSNRVDQAVAEIRRQHPSVQLDEDLVELERQIVASVRQRQSVPVAQLRSYARSFGFSVDTFVVEFAAAISASAIN